MKDRLDGTFVSKKQLHKSSPKDCIGFEDNSPAINLNDLIKKHVIPKWIKYITSKTERREADPTKKPRADTFKKKVLRDMREFYRILFRKRFHLSEYRTLEGVKDCLHTFFKELGLNPSHEDLNDIHLFRYVHQTHLYTSIKILQKGSTMDDSPFKAIEKYNDSRFRTLLKHPLCARMFYFVFNNFLEHYFPLIKEEYKESVMYIVSMSLNLYRRTKDFEDLSRIDYIF
mmetsp:Transcript_4693/g.5398  ORF Transcript_4693/g.5398 Transcript_4693/m.5398 type:complete len:229 (-) Transcript_4693:40-726(-)